MPILDKSMMEAVRQPAGQATVGLNPPEGVMDIRKAPFASGVLIRKGRRVFIATVAHYLDDVPLDRMTMVFSPRATVAVHNLEEARKAASAADWDKETSRCIPVNAIWQNRGTKLEDVAVLEIDPTAVPASSWVYDVDLFRTRQRKPRTGEKLLLSGLKTEDYVHKTQKPPVEGQIPTGHFGRMQTTRYYEATTIQNPAAWRNDDGEQAFFPSYHFALKYPTPNKQAPIGLSGSGVWRVHMERSSSGLLLPSPVLIGIENNYHPMFDAVKVTSIRRVLDLLG